MASSWTIHTLAGELLDVVPMLGHLLKRHAKIIDQEKTTLMQVRALFFLIEHPLTVSTLAKKRGVSLQAASTLVQALVERGWVVRVPDPNDRRQSRLEVTPEGLACAQAAKEQIVNYMASSLEGLEPDEIAAASVFLPALRRVVIGQLGANSAAVDELPEPLREE